MVSYTMPRYFTDFCHTHNLDKYIRPSHSVIKCVWDESSCTWTVTTRNGQTGVTQESLCDVLVSATGVLNAWKWPEVPGVSRFRGQMTHSAAWDKSLDLTGKTVALIGNG